MNLIKKLNNYQMFLDNHLGHIGSSKKLNNYQIACFSVDKSGCPKSKMKNKNHVCYYCYAWDNFFIDGNMDQLKENMDKLKHDPQWVQALTFYIQKIGRCSEFRFFVSGEIPNKNALEKIMKVISNCPRCNFWLPSTKIKLILSWLKKNKKPANCKLILSWTNLKKPISEELKRQARKYDLKISQATEDPNLVNCAADTASNHQCGTCQACFESPSESGDLLTFYDLKIKRIAKRETWLNLQ